MSLSLSKELYFEEFLDRGGNRVKEIHDTHYLYRILTAEDSPFKTYLDRVEPNVKIVLTINLEIIKSKCDGCDTGCPDCADLPWRPRGG